MPGYVPATLVTGFGSPTRHLLLRRGRFGPKYKNAPLHTDAGPRECRIYRHESSGFGMKATSEVFLEQPRATTISDPTTFARRPTAGLYVSDWYDGGVGGHAYNNPDQGRIFLLLPTGKKLARRRKARPLCHNRRRDRRVEEPQPGHAISGARATAGRAARRALPALRDLLEQH